MAWIELHEELPQHPKTKKLARLLGIPRVAAIGHLVSLFTWALQHAQDGVISRYDAPEVADGALWEGEPEQLIAALQEAGWVDETENGLEIHDWWEYAGRLIEKRQANAERMRTARAEKKKDTCDARAKTVRARAGATVPNRTVPNQEPPLPPTGGSESDSLFEEAWRHYPKRAGTNAPKDAKRCWDARVKDGVSPHDLLAATIRYRAFCEATGKIGTEKVMQGQRFYGPSDNWRADWAPPREEGPPTTRHLMPPSGGPLITTNGGKSVFDLLGLPSEPTELTG